MAKKLVNSWTEWAQLEEVVIGRADDICYEPIEPAFRTEFGDPYLNSKIDWPEGRWPQRYIDAANKELDELCNVLEGENIVVKRPDIVETYLASKVPDGKSSWTINTGCGELYARDLIITIGNIILEATTSRRSRFFEYLPYRTIIRDLWMRDKNCLWKACPKPSMNDSMYDQSFWDYTEQDMVKNEGKYLSSLTEKEPAFDVADIMRVGKDIFVQRSLVTNHSAMEWLQRELAGTVNVHPLHFPWDHYPEHIDVTMVPIRPPTSGSNGIVLINEARPPLKSEANIWYANGWDFYVAPEPVIQEEPLTYGGDKWIGSMNTLSINEKLVIIEENETKLEKFYEDLGIECIRLPFRSVNVFGGSFHCVSWDVRRQDEPIDYFPNRPNTNDDNLVTVIDTNSKEMVKNPKPNRYQAEHSSKTFPL